MLDRAKLHHFAPGEGLSAGAHGPGFDDGDWLETTVPGCVHRTLIAAGQIPDPFHDRNETECAWMEEREWWYRLRLHAADGALAADERRTLVFHGLDTFATVWLNGEEIGRHANMFRPAAFDVTGHLRPGENVLAVRFDPPLARIAGKTLSDWGRNPERTAMRKAQFGYGWDWGPRLPTIGIWRPVELRRERAAVLRGVQFGTVELSRAHDRALVAVRVEADRFAGDAPLTASIRLVAPDGQPVVEQSVPLPAAGGNADVTTYATVDAPRLWWTHDLGVPALHELEVRLIAGDDEVDRWNGRVGIRTLALDQSPDAEERGTRFFRFLLNGEPIFARGADWIPCDSFVAAIPAERYERLVKLARDGNMTMLRLWGGGFYEHDAFYDACDRLGILVWQDFMFACAMYPEDDPAFVAEVEAEARYQVRRLRSRACLALWCGNNENQWLHDMKYWDDPAPPPYGELYYHHILPVVVGELDGRTPYWPGSPFGGNDHNSMDQGNRHNWDVWHGQFPRRFGERPRQEISEETVTFRRYAEDRGRFVSEFGMHAAPALATLRQVIPADELYHHSPTMDWHNKDSPKNKGDLLLETVTGLPRDLEEYVDFSQLAQAEGLKFAIEHYRRRKPHCSGALVWQLNDCWPGLSWSVLDYHGIGKAGYFYLRRVFAPVLASFQQAPDGVSLWITNELRQPVADRVTVDLIGFDGRVLMAEELAVEIAANSSRPVRSWSEAELGGGADRVLRVRSGGDRFPANRHFFAAIKDLQRVAGEPRVDIATEAPYRLRVDIEGQAGSYALLTRVEVPTASADFTDNHFDLAPGERRSIVVSSDHEELRPEDVRVRWR